jgi:hypothetical protein
MIALLLILILDARAGQKGPQAQHAPRRFCRRKIASFWWLAIVHQFSVNFAKRQILQQHHRISATTLRLLVPLLYSLALDDAKNTVH